MTENLALVIETTKRGTALQETIADIGRLGTAAQQATAQAAKLPTTMLRFPTEKVQRGALAVRDIAYAAESASLGGKSAVAAFGNLATTLALVSRNAQFGAMASGIGAVVVVASTAVALFQKMNEELKASARTTEHLAAAGDLASATRIYDELVKSQTAARAALEASQPTYAKFGSALALVAGKGTAAAQAVGAIALQSSAAVGALKQLDANVAAAYKRVAELRSKALTESRESGAREAKERAEADAKAALEIGSRLNHDLAAKRDSLTHSSYEAQRLAIGRAYGQEKAAIEQLKIPLAERLELMRQARDVGVATSEILDRERSKAVDAIAAEAKAGRGDVVGDYEAKRAAITAEYERDLREFADNEEAKANIKTRFENKIRALNKDTAKMAMSNATTLTRVLLDSGSRQVRAVGHAADAVRRVAIGAQGAYSAVKAREEGAAALGALAKRDFSGAALHGASAVQFAAAAALALQESLGGGGGGASGGGGSGGGIGGGESTFEADRGRGGGDTVINIIVRDEFGRERIAETRYLLDRSRELKVPLPTSVGSGARFVPDERGARRRGSNDG